MRNLKRVLSLALALVMVLGMMVIGTSAATYTDAEEITQTEAVEVLSALGIVNGMGDGTFAPNGTFTREQAAKLICYMLIGDTAEKLAGTNVFTDVAATRWSSKYISYCANLGIIAGVGNDKFDPTGELTDIALGKMILVALGYDPADYLGANWAAAVTVDMLDAGLVKNVTGTAIAREDACAMILAGMKVGVEEDVYYVTTGGVTFEFEDYTEALLYYAVSNDTSATIVEDTITSETLLEGFDAWCIEDGTDYFGRPATVYGCTDWYYNMYYVDNAVLTYTSSVKGGALYTALGKPNAGYYTYNVVVDGKPVETLTPTTLGLDTANDVIVSGNNATITGTGNGVLTEVYKTGKYEYTIVCMNTYSGVVSNFIEQETNDDGQITVYQAIQIDDDNARTDLYSDGYYVTYDFTKMDKINETTVLYTAAYAGVDEDENDLYFVYDVVAAESETLTATWMTDDRPASFKANGETYKYSQNSYGTVSDVDVTNKVEKVVYFDNYGYVIKVTAVEEADPNYAYIIGLDTDTTVLFGDNAVYAKLLYADGTVGTVLTTEENEDLLTGTRVVKYEEGTGRNAGKIVLTEITAETGYVYAESEEIGKNDATVATKVANSKTAYAVQTTVQGKPVYTGYTGMTNVPGLTANVAAVAERGTLVAVFAMGATLTDFAATSKDVIYVAVDSKKDATDVDLGAYSTYSALVNGEVVSIKVDDSVETLDGFYAAYQTDDDGLVVGVESLTSVAPVGVIAGADTVDTAAKNGVITIEGVNYVYSDSTAIYTVENGKIVAADIDDIEAGDYSAVHGYTTNSILTALIIVE